MAHPRHIPVLFLSLLLSVLLLNQSRTSHAQESPIRHVPLSPAQQKKADARLIALWTDKKGEANDAKSDTMTPQAVQQALNQGADVNAKDRYGDTALIIAAEAGYVSGPGKASLVKLLLDHGADVNVRDKDGWTALILAVLEDHAPVVKLLLEHSADANTRFASMPVLMLAAGAGSDVESGMVTVVKLLLDYGADVNAQDKTNGRTALMEAVFSNHAAAVELLLDHKADVNAQDKYGQTALSMAIVLDRAEIVKLLKAAGAK